MKIGRRVGAMVLAIIVMPAGLQAGQVEGNKVQTLIPGDEISVRKVVGHPAYIQDHWMSRWTDRDGNCQDERNELLIIRSTADTVFDSKEKCNVVAGTWLDVYTGKVFHQPGVLHLDHVVPLAYVHAIGGHQWPRPLRERFSEDHENLLVVTRDSIRSKGDRGPSAWLPIEGRCLYHDQWRVVESKYKLTLKKEDDEALTHLYRQECAEFTHVSIKNH